MRQAIDRVRTNRNSKINSFAERSIVVNYILENYSVELSDRKYEFLSRDLKELLITPVDLVHYASVINGFKSPDNPALDQECERLVMEELTRIFKKYTF